jgi:hypothetical protein
VPSRFLWTCNLSARRSDIFECGAFDEAYMGWGLEDDDFAQQFLRKGKQLLFAQRPWGFHVPHASNSFRNKLEWRRNYEYFFRKFANRELESHAVFKWPDAAMWRVNGALAALGGIDWSDVGGAVRRSLSPCKGRRLCHFIQHVQVAKELGLTDACNPWMPIRASEETLDGIRIWPFFGMRTPFEQGTFEQTLVIVDLAMVLDRYLQVLLLAETVRISRSIVFCCGALARDPQNRFLLDSFRDVVAEFRLPPWSVLVGDDLERGASADEWLEHGR